MATRPKARKSINAVPAAAPAASRQQGASKHYEIWGGDEWQEYVVRLLKQHHGPNDFQEVPDSHLGDYGIEGFSRTKCHAYQCYAAKEPISTSLLYEKQRDKISADIKKFIGNSADLGKIFGKTKINQWTLLVPRFESAELLKHASVKASDVVSAKLPYVTATFQIHIATDEGFSDAREKLREKGAYFIPGPPKAATDADVTSWTSSNDPLVDTLDKKLAHLANGKSHLAREKLRRELIRDFIDGQNTLDRIRRKHPEAYEEIAKLKGVRERSLEKDSILHSGIPSTLFYETLKKYQGELSGQVSGVDSSLATTLAAEAVSDWLLRCPLSFE